MAAMIEAADNPMDPMEENPEVVDIMQNMVDSFVLQNASDASDDEPE